MEHIVLTLVFALGIVLAVWAYLADTREPVMDLERIRFDEDR